jgi:hypothetical protein
VSMRRQSGKLQIASCKLSRPEARAVRTDALSNQVG